MQCREHFLSYIACYNHFLAFCFQVEYGIFKATCSFFFSCKRFEKKKRLPIFCFHIINQKSEDCLDFVLILLVFVHVFMNFVVAMYLLTKGIRFAFGMKPLFSANELSEYVLQLPLDIFFSFFSFFLLLYITVYFIFKESLLHIKRCFANGIQHYWLGPKLFAM